MVQIVSLCKLVMLVEKLALHLNTKHAWPLCSFDYSIQLHNLDFLQEGLPITCPLSVALIKHFQELFGWAFQSPVQLNTLSL